jgi:hypothetical protein
VYKKIFYILLLGMFLMGCAPAASMPTNETVAPTALATETDTPLPPTQTPAPTATATLIPTPDFTLVGLPAEETGTTAFDFVAQMCDAEWFTRGQELSCPGNESQKDLGYVMQLDGTIQGLPSNLGVLLAYPPQLNFGTISSKYPSFTVEKGDRFRVVLACRAHTFCDVQFDLGYYDEQGWHTGLKHWRYLFADSAIVVDYSLDSIAGKTVQFDLAVLAKGNRSDAYAVWIAPHIYRPVP